MKAEHAVTCVLFWRGSGPVSKKSRYVDAQECIIRKEMRTARQ